MDTSPSPISTSRPPVQKRRAPSPPCLLALLLLISSLSGCVDKEAVIRLGVFTAPLSILLMSFTLYESAKRFPIFAANPYLRPWVLALPFIIASLIGVLLWIKINSTGEDTKKLSDWILGGGLLVSMLMFVGLETLTHVIWRIWLVFSPRTSYEGANILGPVLFFGPGILYAHGFYKKELYPVLEWLIIYNAYSFFIFPVVMVLFRIEAWYRQRAQQRKSQETRSAQQPTS